MNIIDDIENLVTTTALGLFCVTVTVAVYGAGIAIIGFCLAAGWRIFTRLF